MSEELKFEKISPIPADMVLVPGGTNAGIDPDHGDYSLTVDSFFMDKYLVTKEKWDEVYNWAINEGYTFESDGESKGANHPVFLVNWWDCIKWCNARSEKEGRPAAYLVDGAVYKRGRENNVTQANVAGYRLPTDIEWEYAARGGLQGKRFTWGDTISHNEANFRSFSNEDYDVSTTQGYHPDYMKGSEPYTSPVGSFPPNGYGLYDMVGNLWEWFYDWFPGYAGTARILRSGAWDTDAEGCRVGRRGGAAPSYANRSYGLRTVLSSSNETKPKKTEEAS